MLTTVVAFLSLACAPMPFLFYRYGAFLRRHSKYAPSGPQEGSGSECEDKVPQPAAEDALEPEFGPDAGKDAGMDELCRSNSCRSVKWEERVEQAETREMGRAREVRVERGKEAGDIV